MRKYKITITLDYGVELQSEISGIDEVEVIKGLLAGQFNTIIGNPTLVYNRDKIISIQSKEIN